MKNIYITLLIFLSCSAVWAQDLDNVLKDTQKKEGFFNFYVSEQKGKIYLEVNELNKEFLYYSSLSRGVGSNDIGLDRGKVGRGKVVKFVRSGNKLLLQEPNYSYRALSSDNLEKKAVEESFATSVLFGFEIIGQKDNKFYIDLSPFLLRDGVGAIEAISSTRQGTYTFDASKSGLFLEMTKSFPENTEFETIITLSGSNAGSYLRSVVPSAEHVSMHQHHSFVKLPDSGFKTRELDPRMGYFGIEYFDYSSPIDEPIAKKLIARHRLEKKDPNAALSEPVKPIVYYLDSGVPEPIRAALFEGATWWNEAFEAAGFKNAFQVKMLPADADPMDVRYNIVQWVHRSTRGWSYGASIIDPRTGEILKGKVSLGSLRVRQDYLIAQGLLGDFDAGKEQTEMLKMSLDRLKQLSAHEIGHTLGLPHNYIASSQNRASVMDYPHPKIDIINGKLSLDDAYAMGIGEFDKMAIQWGYQEFSGNEKAELNKIVEKAAAKGLIFLSDQDARPDGSVHPQTHLWDNGKSASTELNHVIEVRKIALKDFGAKKIPAGTPYANLEEVLVPMYMLHRFQTQATAKVLGGAYYTYAVKGDNGLIFKAAPANEQREALRVLLKTLSTDFLALDTKTLELIPPRAYRFGANSREVFKRFTGMTFDLLGPVEASAQLTLSLIFNPERVSRMAQNGGASDSFSLKEVLKTMTNQLWNTTELKENTYQGQIKRQVALMYLSNLLSLSQSTKVSFEAKMAIYEELTTIKNKSLNLNGGLLALINTMWQRFEKEPQTFSNPSFFEAPDGQPIDEDYNWLGIDCD